MEGFGKRLRELRTASELSQEAVAARLGVSAQSVSKWENGRSLPDVTFIVPLAELFHISTDELMGKERQRQKWDDEWERAIRAGNPGEAVKTALEALEYFPERLHFLWKLAEAEYMAAAFKEGEEKRRMLEGVDINLRAILHQFPDFEGAIRRRADVLVRLGRFQEAEALARKLPDPDEALLLVLQDKNAWQKQRRRVLAKRAQSFWDMLANLDLDLAERFLLEYPWDERDRIDLLSSICDRRAQMLCSKGELDEAMSTLNELRELSRRMKEARAHPETSEALFAYIGNDDTTMPDTMIHGFSTVHCFKALEGREEYQSLLRLAMRMGREEEDFDETDEEEEEE
jgi:transcriptional regulator with XRE-family HTH domain